MKYLYMEYASPVGKLTLVSNTKALVGLWIEGQKHFCSSLPQEALSLEMDPILEKSAKWLDDYFSGRIPCIRTLPLQPEGTGFQQTVWQKLCKIPYGQTSTYGQIAKEIAAELGKGTMSSQAVGQAVGRNPISIIIPCHRVIGAGGKLTGYDGGLDKKLFLLNHESAI